MPKFLFVYRSEPYTKEQISPEQMQQVMQLWTNWIGEGFQKGWMLDAGDALLPDGKTVNSKKVVTDGPFAEAKEIVGGYSIVQAASYEAAAQLVVHRLRARPKSARLQVERWMQSSKAMKV